MNRQKITEGKTKIIWSTADKETILIESKDDITAGDGAKHDVVENKGLLATETTCNCFSLLNTVGIPNHFIRREGERTFLARWAKMIPIELVVRRIATGSYLKRHPEIAEGTIFDPLVFETFYKDDSLHDPLIVWNGRRKCTELYNANASGPKSYLFDLNPKSLLSPLGDSLKAEDLDRLGKIAHDVFMVLEKAWAKLQVILVDLKIECGWTLANEIVVADVIDNDSWRIWPGGDKTRMVDKQVYRDLEGTTPRALETIKKNYVWVAESTRRFL